jgi:hypothetical protein
MAIDYIMALCLESAKIMIIQAFSVSHACGTKAVLAYQGNHIRCESDFQDSGRMRNVPNPGC